jgi:5-hydroxyisourate hydrolase
MMISTQVVDIATGCPAASVPVELDLFISGHGWREVGRGVTNDEGRVQDFGEPAAAGVYRLMFDVASYAPESFFPSVAVTFEVGDASGQYHIPLLLSSFGYTVYRGTPESA